jgi:hypothetical protein
VNGNSDENKIDQREFFVGQLLVEEQGLRPDVQDSEDSDGAAPHRGAHEVDLTFCENVNCFETY